MITESAFNLRIREIVKETPNAHTVVLDIPGELQATFAYEPGQFLTVGVPSDRVGLVARCYSLSSAPHSGQHRFTVKRTLGGYASNWLIDNLRVGDTLRVLPPSGVFTPRDLDADLLLFAAGSGITPLMSIARSGLERGTGKVVLFYANRGPESVIFEHELSDMVVEHPRRLTVRHWLESAQGLPSVDALVDFAAGFTDFSAFVCGPAPYMDAVIAALRQLGFPRERRQHERFVSLDGNPFERAGTAPSERGLEDRRGPGGERPVVAAEVEVDVKLNGRRSRFYNWRGEQSLLEFLEQKGVPAPSACRAGQCSSCACVVLEGEVLMRHNEVLDDEDLADGVRLACQSWPVSKRLRITFDA